MHSRYIAIPCLFLGCSIVQADANRQIVTRLDAVLNRLDSTGAVLHANVIELPGKRVAYAQHAEKVCVPASNYKLLTSATALDLFGINHRVKTYLAMDGDDLWIIGTGDPGTGDPRIAKAVGGKPTTMFDHWCETLKQRGIRQIQGDLVYDDSAFERDILVHPTWNKNWLRDWYAAPVAGLNFNDNCVDITIYPTQEGQIVAYDIMPPVENIRVLNECMTQNEGTPLLSKQRNKNVFRLSGGCSSKTELMSKPITDPGSFFADALRVHLKSHGVDVMGSIRRADAPLGGTIPPPSAKIIAVHETSLSDILSRCNKNSQNLFAESLCKMAGREHEARRGNNVPGSWENGGRAIREFLRKNGIDDTALVAIDGSGISPANRVTATMMTDLLALMLSRPDGEAYRASLSAAGVDGSLRNRMPDLKKHVFAKSGYIGGTCALAGYIQTKPGTWLAFAFIFNNCPEKAHNPTDVASFTELQDEACRILMGWAASE